MLGDRRIKIVGLGGIGSALCDNLCRFLNHQPTRCRLVLIDGDDYEIKNKARQSFNQLGNKARVKCTEMRLSHENISFDDVAEYLTPSNIGEYIQEDDVVFLCVDNHKTRKVVSDHAKTLENVIVISGGNEYTDGNVQIFIREGGENKTPSLSDYHPEIAHPGDKSPDEMSCEELANSEPQLLFANLSVATIMCWTFYNILEGKLAQNSSEVYFDMLKMNTLAKQRKPRAQK